MELTDLTAFCLWFALLIPSYTLCQCQAIRPTPSTRNLLHNQGKKAAWRIQRIHREAELLPMGPLLMPAHREGNSPGQGVLREFWAATVQMQGSWVLLPWKRSSDGIS